MNAQLERLSRAAAEAYNEATRGQPQCVEIPWASMSAYQREIASTQVLAVLRAARSIARDIDTVLAQLTGS